MSYRRRAPSVSGIDSGKKSTLSLVSSATADGAASGEVQRDGLVHAGENNRGKDSDRQTGTIESRQTWLFKRHHPNIRDLETVLVSVD